MPVYCYRNKKGRLVEKVYPIGKAPFTIVIGKQKYTRCFQAESVSVPASAGWPMACFASGVHPDQAGELRKHLADRGVPTEVTAGGDPIYKNAAHRRKALKARGFVDRSSFI